MSDVEAIVCAHCGMRVPSIGHYHPYAACLMFKACHNSATVEANLKAVVEHGRLRADGDAKKKLIALLVAVRRLRFARTELDRAESAQTQPRLNKAGTRFMAAMGNLFKVFDAANSLRPRDQARKELGG